MRSPFTIFALTVNLDDRHIEMMASGDHTAFRQLFDAWESRMLFYAYRLTGDRTVSRDIVQDTFVLLWDKRRSLGTMLAAKAFVYTSIRNKVWRHVRDDANRRRILDNMAAEPERPGDRDDDLAAVAEICGEIQRAVAGLAPQSRRIMELGMQGLTVEQTAELMGVSPNTVKSLKKAAYKHLREQLNHLKALLFFIF